MKVTCKDDNKTQVNYNLNLSEVKVVKPEGHSNKIMLSDDMGIMMKYPGMNDFISGSIMGKAPSADGVIEIIAGCIDQIFDGEDVYDSSTTSKKEFVQFLEGLTNNQFEKIQAFFEGTPRLEHTFTVKNPETGEPSEFTIVGLSNFFG
jgi:hypothetical protein